MKSNITPVLHQILSWRAACSCEGLPSRAGGAIFRSHLDALQAGYLPCLPVL